MSIEPCSLFGLSYFVNNRASLSNRTFFCRVTFPTINLMPIIRLLNTSPELTPIHPPSSSSFRSLLKHIFTLCAALSQNTILSLSECDSLSFRILYQHDPFFLSGAILQRHFRMKRHKSTPHG